MCSAATRPPAPMRSTRRSRSRVASPELGDDLQLLPWLTLGPIFLRETGAGRPLLAQALRTARARAALGALPFVLNLLARDQATTDRWAVAEATYQEAIALARETEQRTDLGFGLAGLAWLQARRGREAETRALAAEAIELSVELGARLYEVWAAAALGELELGLGDAGGAAEHFEAAVGTAARARDHRRGSLARSGARRRLRAARARRRRRAGRRRVHGRRRGQGPAVVTGPGAPLPRSARRRSTTTPSCSSRRSATTPQTPDEFETARTRLAYGQRLRRARNRVLAREQLRAAVDTFERLDARPWAERARTELAATGETLRRRDPSTIDELTPQELQIALLLADGKTTREAAAALFLSPKTIEYHLRHVYQKLDIHSREELAEVLATRAAGDGERVEDPLT